MAICERKVLPIQSSFESQQSSSFVSYKKHGLFLGNYGHDIDSNFVGNTKSKVLVIGATGYIGGFIAQASVASGHPTFALVRPSTDFNRIKELSNMGIHILYGSLDDRENLVPLLKGKDVVISAVGGDVINKQLNLISAMEQVGTVKRFLPSEFGHDIDKAQPVEPGLSFYMEKRNIRRAVEIAGIPYTYICCNSIASWPYFDETHPSEIPPPTDEFVIYGDGNTKAYFVTGEDIGKFTMKAVEDTRTLNKTIHFRPPNNFVSMNELSCMWETIISKNLPRTYISEQELLDMAEENKFPASIVASLTHDIFINGCQWNFDIDGKQELQVTELYPEERFTTIQQFFVDFLDSEQGPKTSCHTAYKYN